jgi:hypothetical protein
MYIELQAKEVRTCAAALRPRPGPAWHHRSSGASGMFTIGLRDHEIISSFSESAAGSGTEPHFSTLHRRRCLPCLSPRILTEQMMIPI